MKISMGVPPDRESVEPKEKQSILVIEGEELKKRVHIDVNSRIGGGSSGRVYKAQLDGAPVAAKIIHPSAARREDAVSSFLREAHLLARLSHGNIIKVLALCQLPPAFNGLPTRRYTWGLLMELAEAGPLTGIIRGCQSGGPGAGPNSKGVEGGSPHVQLPPAVQQQPSPSGGHGHSVSFAPLEHEIRTSANRDKGGYTDVEAVGWCLDIARALDYLHSQRPPIVHRDVKTENVLVSTSAVAAHGVQSSPQGAAAVLALTRSSLDKSGSPRVPRIRLGSYHEGARKIAKLADFGLHVVLDSSRPILGLRRRSSSVASQDSVWLQINTLPQGSYTGYTLGGAGGSTGGSATMSPHMGGMGGRGMASNLGRPPRSRRSSEISNAPPSAPVLPSGPAAAALSLFAREMSGNLSTGPTTAQGGVLQSAITGGAAGAAALLEANGSGSGVVGTGSVRNGQRSRRVSGLAVTVQQQQSGSAGSPVRQRSSGTLGASDSATTGGQGQGQAQGQGAQQEGEPSGTSSAAQAPSTAQVSGGMSPMRKPSRLTGAGGPAAMNSMGQGVAGGGGQGGGASATSGLASLLASQLQAAIGAMGSSGGGSEPRSPLRKPNSHLSHANSTSDLSTINERDSTQPLRSHSVLRDPVGSDPNSGSVAQLMIGGGSNGKPMRISSPTSTSNPGLPGPLGGGKGAAAALASALQNHVQQSQGGGPSGNVRTLSGGPAGGPPGGARTLSGNPMSGPPGAIRTPSGGTLGSPGAVPGDFRTSNRPTRISPRMAQTTNAWAAPPQVSSPTTSEPWPGSRISGGQVAKPDSPAGRMSSNGSGAGSTVGAAHGQLKAQAQGPANAAGLGSSPISAAPSVSGSPAASPPAANARSGSPQNASSSGGEPVRRAPSNNGAKLSRAGGIGGGSGSGERAGASSLSGGEKPARNWTSVGGTGTGTGGSGGGAWVGQGPGSKQPNSAVNRLAQGLGGRGPPAHMLMPSRAAEIAAAQRLLRGDGAVFNSAPVPENSGGSMTSGAPGHSRLSCEMGAPAKAGHVSHTSSGAHSSSNHSAEHAVAMDGHGGMGQASGPGADILQPPEPQHKVIKRLRPNPASFSHQPRTRMSVSMSQATTGAGMVNPSGASSFGHGGHAAHASLDVPGSAGAAEGGPGAAGAQGASAWGPLSRMSKAGGGAGGADTPGKPTDTRRSLDINIMPSHVGMSSSFTSASLSPKSGYNAPRSPLQASMAGSGTTMSPARALAAQLTRMNAPGSSTQGMLNNAPNGGSTAAALEQWVAAGGGSSSNASGSMAAAAAGLGSGRRPSLHAPSRSGSRSHVTSSVLHGGQLSKGPSGRGAPTEEAEEVDTLGKSMPSSLLSMRPSASQQHAVLMVQQAQLQAQAQLAQQLLQVRGGSSRPGSTGRPGSSGPAVSGQQPTTAPTAGGSSAGPTLYSATQLAVGASSAGRTSTGGGAGAAHSGPLPFPIQNTTSSQLLPNIASPFVAAGSIAEANQPAGNNSGPFVKLSQNTVTQLMVAGGSHGGAPPSPCPSEWQGWTNPGEEAGEMELVYALTGRAGTSLYMAPEIVREEPYNEKIDVYSFAMVMYEVFGRTLLLANRTREELDGMAMRMASGFRPRRLDRITDDGVWQLIQAMWAQDPVARPTMGQVVSQLAMLSQQMVDAANAAALRAEEHVMSPRSNAAGRSMSIMRGFNISLKSRALTASMRSRVSKVSIDGTRTSANTHGTGVSDSAGLTSGSSPGPGGMGPVGAGDDLLEPPPPPPSCGPCGCVIC